MSAPAASASAKPPEYRLPDQQIEAREQTFLGHSLNALNERDLSPLFIQHMVLQAGASAGRAFSPSILRQQELEGIQHQVEALFSRFKAPASQDKPEEQAHTIDFCKESAGSLYLKSPVNIERRKRIDLLKSQAYYEASSQEQAAIINKYWDFIATSRTGEAVVKKIEARAAQLFLNSVVDFAASLPEKLAEKERSSLELGEFLAEAMQQPAIQTHAKLIEERKLSVDVPEQLALDYLLLMRPVIMDPLLKQVHIQLLTNMVEGAERLVLTFLETDRKSWNLLVSTQRGEKETYESRIQMYESSLQETRKLLDELRADLSGDAKETQQLIQLYTAQVARESAFVKENQESLLAAEKKLKEMEARPEQDLIEMSFKRCCENLHMNPRELRAQIPQLTAGENLILKVLEISADAIRISPGVHSNKASLTSKQAAELTTHFLHQMVQKDAQILQLLTSKVTIEDVE